MGTAAATHIGELRERLTLERFTAGAWAIDSVLSAKVRPGPPPRIPEAADWSIAPVSPGERFEITLRYRSDFGDDARALRVRRGSTSLIVLQTISDVDGDRHWSRLVCERFIDYVTRHDAMLAQVATQGAAITFTKPTTSSNLPATFDPDTDTVATPAMSSSVTGVAVEESNALGYDDATFEQRATRTLVFVPTTYGDLPFPGAVATWNGEAIVAETVSPIAPNGMALGARVVLAR